MNVDTGQRKQEKKKEKIPKIVATFVYASSQGQRTHSVRTNNKKPGHSLNEDTRNNNNNAIKSLNM